jgi:alpha-methylacyl-CoA racemase
MEGSDICFAPVLSMEEAPSHPQNRHRGSFVELDGVPQPAPAPRFSRTPSSVSRPPAAAGQHTDEALRDWGFSPSDVAKLKDAGVVQIAAATD